VTDVWIVNASPVIALAKVDGLQLLRDSCRELLVPQAAGLYLDDGVVSSALHCIGEKWD